LMHERYGAKVQKMRCTALHSWQWHVAFVISDPVASRIEGIWAVMNDDKAFCTTAQ
jgi:hypothetical protein